MPKKGGKKGKKKKVTGTPDVIIFKSTREFILLQALSEMLIEFPSVSKSEELTADETFKFSKVLHYLGTIANMRSIGLKKEYRFQLRHPLSIPKPQLYPIGYPIDVVRVARNFIDKPTILLNQQEFTHSESTKTAAREFLTAIETESRNICLYVDEQLKADFAESLDKFVAETTSKLVAFDTKWSDFEISALTETRQFHDIALQPLSFVVSAEAALNDVERAKTFDPEKKRVHERRFITTCCHLAKSLKLPLSDIPENVLELAETVIFFSSRFPIELSQASREIFDASVELRVMLSAKDFRVNPDLPANPELVIALTRLSAAVSAGEEAMRVAGLLPGVYGLKKSGWLVKASVAKNIRKQIDVLQKL